MFTLKPDQVENWNKFVENNKDPYGSATIEFAQRWAQLMEKRIDGGAKLEDIAKECSDIADTDGITGYMYGRAVGALYHAWIHGQTLGKWHNRQYGVDESKKGVVNPAILTIG